MTAPPARNTLSGTPTNAQFNAGIGALYDYTVGLLGADGTPAAARAALGAVGLTGNQTIGGVKIFSNAPTLGRTNLDTEGGHIDFQRASDGIAHYALDVFGTGTTPSFRLLNALKGAVAWIVDDNHNFRATGNITAGGQFIGNGAGLTNVPASAIAGALNAAGSAPIYACRAWVNFNGTGTVAIRASGNVSSITDNGVGNYEVNLTTAMTDANYAVAITSFLTADSNAYALGTGGQGTTSRVSVRLNRAGTVATLDDSLVVSVAIFR